MEKNEQRKLRHLDLFSGIGGFSLGLESTGGFETVGFCDNEPFAQKVLKKHWPNVPIYEDVRNVGVETIGYRGVDIITGGFPCQSVSVAGLQKATEDDRWLWPEMFRIIKEIRPTYVLGENVRNLVSINNGVVFEQVCVDLESEGYETKSLILPASSQNAPHLRYRCWIISVLADTRCEYGQQRNAAELDKKQTKRSSRTVYDKSGSERQSTNVADTKSRKPWKQTDWQRGEGVGRGSFDSAGDKAEGQKEKRDAANTNDTRDRTSRSRIDKNWEKEVKGWEEQPQFEPSRYSEDVANTKSKRLPPFKNRAEIVRASEEKKILRRSCDARGTRQADFSRSEEHWQRNTGGGLGGTGDGVSKRIHGHWGDNWEEGTPRVAEGQKNRAQRLKALGNSVIPQIPAVLGRAILEVHWGDTEDKKGRNVYGRTNLRMLSDRKGKFVPKR